MSKPKVVHVYRVYSGTLVAYDGVRRATPSTTVYLGEYVPATGPVVAERWEVRTKRKGGSISSVYGCPSERIALKESRALHAVRTAAGLKKEKHYIVHIVTRKKAKR